MLDRRDEIVETSRARRVVLRALVNAFGDGSNDPLWRSEIDRMDVLHPATARTAVDGFDATTRICRPAREFHQSELAASAQYS